MKTISPYFDPIHDTIMWVQASPINAAIGCAVMYFSCWIISYYAKDLI